MNRLFIIGNGPSLQKMNLAVLRPEITIGVNAILYNGFQPTYLAITDTVVMDQYPADILLGSSRSIYIFSRRIYQKYRERIQKYLPASRIHLIQLVDQDFMFPKVKTFDPNFKRSHVSYSIMIDVAFPLAYFLGYPQVYLIGIDHGNYKHHSYDAFLKSVQSSIPNPQGIPGYNDAIQAEDLSRRYQKAYHILQRAGIEIYNAGLDSQLEVFPKKSWIKLFPTGLKNSLPPNLDPATVTLPGSPNPTTAWTLYLSLKVGRYQFQLIPIDKQQKGDEATKEKLYLGQVRLRFAGYHHQLVLAVHPGSKALIPFDIGKVTSKTVPNWRDYVCWMVSTANPEDGKEVLTFRSEKSNDGTFTGSLRSKVFPGCYLMLDPKSDSHRLE